LSRVTVRRQLRQVEVDRVHLLVETSAENAHFACIVEHRIQKIGVHAAPSPRAPQGRFSRPGNTGALLTSRFEAEILADRGRRRLGRRNLD